MNFYSRELFLDQFTPVSIYEKIKNLYKNEITFLFESTINSSTGNYSYIIIGDRERVWYENETCFYKNEKQEFPLKNQMTEIFTNVFVLINFFIRK